jgi:inorganic pyrophosphatase
MKEGSKRKRSRQEMEDVREFETSFKEDRQQFFQKAKRLKEEKDMLDQQVIELGAAHQVLQNLYSQGVVDA